MTKTTRQGMNSHSLGELYLFRDIITHSITKHTDDQQRIDELTAEIVKRELSGETCNLTENGDN
jgi:hypothetical protein